MPIANCIISADCSAGVGNLIDFWAKESGQPSEHMTINIIKSSEQLGRHYKVMATLYLPSLWPSSAISSLQLGLAKGLAKYFGQPIEQVHIITSIVGSGSVIETGQQQTW